MNEILIDTNVIYVILKRTEGFIFRHIRKLISHTIKQDLTVIKGISDLL